MHNVSKLLLVRTNSYDLHGWKLMRTMVEIEDCQGMLLAMEFHVSLNPIEWVTWKCCLSCRIPLESLFLRDLSIKGMPNLLVLLELSHLSSLKERSSHLKLVKFPRIRGMEPMMVMRKVERYERVKMSNNFENFSSERVVQQDDVFEDGQDLL